MATLSSLLEYYYETMQEALLPLEEERKRIVKKLQTTAFYIGLGVIVFFIVLHKQMHFSPLQASVFSVMIRLFDIYVCLPSRKSGFYGSL